MVLLLLFSNLPLLFFVCVAAELFLFCFVLFFVRVFLGVAFCVLFFLL